MLGIPPVVLQINAVALHYRLGGEVDQREVDRRDGKGDQPRDDRYHDGVGGEHGEGLDLYQAEVGRDCDAHTDSQHAEDLEENADAVCDAELRDVVCDYVEGFVGAAAVPLRIDCNLNVGSIIQKPEEAK